MSQPWCKASEKLPKCNESVLCVILTPFFGNFDAEMCVGHYDSARWVDNLYNKIEVAYWQELPKLPGPAEYIKMTQKEAIERFPYIKDPYFSGSITEVVE